MKQTCKRITKRRFLFWTWEEVTYYHDWVYDVNKAVRECSDCKQKEILYRSKWNVEHKMYIEDWRRTK